MSYDTICIINIITMVETLPEDIHILKYKKIFNNSVNIIPTTNSKSLYEFYDFNIILVT